MTSKTIQEICDILIAKGPDLLQKIELSELFYQYLASEKVLQDTQLRDLKVGASYVNIYIIIPFPEYRHSLNMDMIIVSVFW